MSVLSVHNLRKSFGGVRAVDGVSFEVGDGEFLALIGPNGAGKSTCFNMINGQLAPDHLLGLVAERLLGRAVDLHHAALVVHRDDGVEGGVEGGVPGGGG